MIYKTEYPQTENSDWGVCYEKCISSMGNEVVNRKPLHHHSQPG